MADGLLPLLFTEVSEFGVGVGLIRQKTGRPSAGRNDFSSTYKDCAIFEEK